MARQRTPDPPADDVPAWVMTFSDVITLLMTFFILLLTFATNQPETFDRMQVAMFGGGGANGFASDADGMEKDTLLLRERARSGRMTDQGSEVPPIYSDPSLASFSKSLAGLEQEEIRVLSTSYRIEQTLESLVNSQGMLTSQGKTQMRMLAAQLTKRPTRMDLIVRDEGSLLRARTLAEFLSQEGQVPEAKIGTGIAPNHVTKGYLLLVIAKQGANRGAKIKPPDELPSKAWLMSFGDTMTTLLAFFIVLCSLAEDQTGANLHTGTGSFVQTLKAGGMPGAFSGDKSQRAVQLEATSPLYLPSDMEPQKELAQGAGPDNESNEIRSKDREQEEFMRLINELERMANTLGESDTIGETTFDFFEKLNTAPPYLPANFDDIAIRIIPLLRKNTHRVELIVWATTPSASARLRASRQSGLLVAEITKQGGISADQAKRILGISRVWAYKDIKRPVLSIVIRRVR